MSGASAWTGAEVRDCDVCIIGAGVAGLNAAFVASRYLSPDQKIILVDRHHQASGMWNDAYDYVRLHQPHGVFTAGNIPWTLGREPEYLATRDEVVDHLRHCLEVIAQRVQVECLWGWEYAEHAEAAGRVWITAHSLDGSDGCVITADRLIKATGFDVEVNPALPLSSEQVRSVSPNSFAVCGPEMRESRAPVWVVGSGKTAMDTVHALVQDGPGREVGLVAGSGTYFFNRDRLYPVGPRRWMRGTRPNAIFAQAARLFDGTNEAEVRAWVLDRCGTSVLPSPEHNMFGILSEAEVDVIRAGLGEVLRDHLVDVVDRDGDPVMLLRSGATRSVQPGSWIVNCTGYLNSRDTPFERYVSASGAVLSINRSSLTFGFSSFSAYFLTHLLFLGRLSDLPLFVVDFNELTRKGGAAVPGVVSALLQYNLSVIFDAVPSSVFRDCGLDFDRWYPMPRQLAGQLQFMLLHRRDRERHRRTLETVAERFAMRCGPLVPV